MRFFTLLMLLLLLPALHLHSQLPKHMIIAKSYIGTVEMTGNNDGPKIEYIIKRGGGTKGSSYCAYFVSMCIDSAKAKTPTVRTGVAINFRTKNSISANDVLIGKKQIPTGTILIFRHGNTWHGHTGFVLKWNKKSGTTIEANTSSGVSGSQSNGDGIWQRTRSIEPLNYFRIVSFTPVTY